MLKLDDLPTPQRRALDLVRDVAMEKRCEAFLVGGPVRDLLLGRPAVDIDLTLEEGSSTLARALARRIDGRVRSFPQFLTYKVTADGFPDIDIATARKERYRKPGALPSVTAGHLRDDLMRRDFAINAIAVDLRGETMHDPAGGRDDIRDRVVRVLHDQSFADDPTRVFRALRLGARLGFTIEPHTAALMRAAIEAGALTNISKERIWRELFLAMDEHEAPRVVAALSQEGALRSIVGPPRVDDTLVSHLELMRDLLTASPELDRYVLYSGVLLRGDASPVDLEGSGFSMKRSRNVMSIANELPRFLDALAEETTDRKRFKLLRTASPEMLGVLGLVTKDGKTTVERFRDYQQFTLAVRGNDLGVPPGPHVARALERSREAVFLGEVPEKEARSFAREKAMKYFKRDQAIDQQ